ncbi:neuronal PAS domain-containing protein 4 [Aplysia californica]|uniref:Neuronal PAS domain-containing protein 4 n=1 Tax=Aplysia californica TaxID=6500 RepID=A0ABM0ZVG4_APLCA|nr:neuronal PAS domain-containing protein 4 [Aplysia californica]
MVDMKTQGDSLYDIVDKRDQDTVQAQLMAAGQPDPCDPDDVSFFCRMNMSRTLKRQSGFGDVKVRGFPIQNCFNKF